MSGYNNSRVPENNNTSGKFFISPYNGETFQSDKSASSAQDLASASKVSTCSRGSFLIYFLISGFDIVKSTHGLSKIRPLGSLMLF